MTSKSKARSSGQKGTTKKRHCRSAYPRLGIFVFLTALIGLAILSGTNLRPPLPLYVAGEVAAQDVLATQNLLFEDTSSTLAKRKQVAALQPPIYDLDRSPISKIQDKFRLIFDLINSPIASASEEDSIRWQIEEILNVEVSRKTFSHWKEERFQSIFYTQALPYLIDKLNKGIVADSTLMLQNRNGYLIRDLAHNNETLHSVSFKLGDLASIKKGLVKELRKKGKAPLRTRNAVLSLVSPVLTPTITPNRVETQQREQLAVESIDPVYYSIKKGESIVRKGERVTLPIQIKLQALLAHKNQRFFPYQMLGVFMTTLLLGAGLAFERSGRRLSSLRNEDLFFTTLVIILFAGGAKAFTLLQGHFDGTQQAVAMLPILYPVAGALGLSGLIFGIRRCSVISLIISFLCTVMLGGTIEMFLFYFIGSMLNVWLVQHAESRKDIALSGLPLMGGLVITWLGLALYQQLDMPDIIVGATFAAANGIISLLVVFALSPIIELVFNYTTRFKLMELMNLEQPLLQELMMNAPGTYHHSLILSNLVEAGAKSIGANSLLCKVAALYHDIGKLIKPQYFIENQGRAKNPHDKLTPAMSTLILISHVKKGVELARKYRLGHEIEDIIQQHHGTSVIRYFYTKAAEQDDSLCKDDFRYPGPKPKSREAAIVMLADAVEASSRVLADPTPSRLKGHIDTIIKGIFSEGQLDDSELTFADLTKVGESFHRVLTGIFHRRIEYPEEQRAGCIKNHEEKNGNGDKPKNGPAPEAA
ncbi:HDIG domain-containing metalloprotein [Halodesulfovibrio sp.]|jgi:putative nucleotidyltransferase with HDIG domain|uniref:HD family phosphohydrolase n=1 Tax=Halodesulfovibrio sp. TaxID=1912772 RepID=UPI0025CEC2DC|nr:HDIG domain-containing metalloprotein [Halodesulfovibrio sp.]MCT4533789.1 HDIG domain-containing protein [Halodesulfovibrio sp.]MCT4627563.1 HDIG domain-containing protein [Halodesulfovibrio sp.]